MKTPTVRLVFDRKKQATKTKKALIQIEVAFNRQRKYISTDTKVFKNQYNNTSNSVINHQDADILNQLISGKVTEIRKFFLDLNEKKEEFTFEKLDLFLSNKKTCGDSFLKFMESRIEKRNITESTKRQHRVTLRKVISFGKIVTFSDLTSKNIRAFDEWIKESITHQVTVHGIHKRLKVYVREAVEKGYIDANPYDKVRISRGKSKDIRYLESEEIEKIEKVELIDEVMQKTRDIFIFACYTGLAYSDIKNLTNDNIVRKGNNYYIEGNRQKTNSKFFTPILPKAIEVLKKYNFSLPVVSMEVYNMRLKALAVCVGIKKTLSSHVARHTFATTVTLANGVPIEVLSKMLGHSDIKTTQIYAKVLNKSITEVTENLISRI